MKNDMVLSLEDENNILRKRIGELEKEKENTNKFVAQLSHEIRTPLNVVIGMASIAKEEIGDRQKTIDCLAEIESSSRVLLGIVNDVIDISALSSGNLEIDNKKFDLKDEITNLAILFYEQAKQRNIHFDIHVKGVSEEFIVGDEKRLNQILMNLLNNAIRCTPSGGKIELSVVQASSSRERVHMRFIIKDTGHGIEKQVFDDVFKDENYNEFVQVGKHGEAGFSLSIANSLVTLMNGTIIANSDIHEGTEIIVDIPFERTAQREKQSLGEIINVRCLIVADQEEVAIERGEMLADMGMDYEISFSETETLDKIGQREDENKPYKMCMIDWDMGGFSAKELILKIREYYGEEMVIIVTAHNSVNEYEAGINAGANYVIENTLFRSTLFDALMEMEQGRIEKQDLDLSVQNNFDFTGKKVLVVEDVSLNMEVVVKLLRRVNTTIVCADNGLEAVNTFVIKPDNYFDCILMDVNMPIMDGYDATKTIRKCSKKGAASIPIIAMTANAFSNDVKDALDAGMDGHIAKPIDVNILYSTLEKIFFDEKSGEVESELKKRTEKLELQNRKMRMRVERDSLTNLYNRYAFEKKEQQLLLNHNPIGFLIIDVDEFNEINDTYGQETGDKVLKRVSDLLSKTFRNTDFIVRFGGDEFVVILCDYNNKAHTVVDKVNDMNRKLKFEREGLPGISLSAGFAFCETGYTSELYEQADRALYNTKNNGKCGCSIFGEF